MAKRDNNRIVAETMFIEQGMTCKAIAELIDVSEKTLSKWRNDGQWDQKREESLAAPHRIREILLKELKTLADGGAGTIDADALSKIAKVMDTISEKISPQLVISVLKGFDNWMADQDAQMAVAFLTYHKQYIQHVIQQHG